MERFIIFSLAIRQIDKGRSDSFKPTKQRQNRNGKPGHPPDQTCTWPMSACRDVLLTRQDSQAGACVGINRVAELAALAGGERARDQMEKPHLNGLH